MNIKGTIWKRFWEKVDIPADENECWLWTGAVRPDGYGVIGLGTREEGTIRAHVLSWKLAKGHDVPDGMFICHHCDNPPCVNPHHLFLGDARANSHDARSKGRLFKLPLLQGETHPKSKLTEKDVIQIREIASLHTQRALAKKYGVSRRLIHNVLRRKTWTHI